MAWVLRISAVAVGCAPWASAQQWKLYAGSPGRHPGTVSQNRFDYPSVIELCHLTGEAYVGNIANNVNDIRIVHPNGELSGFGAPLTKSKDSEYSSPQGLAFSLDGTIYVSDTFADRLLKKPPSQGWIVVQEDIVVTGLAVSHHTGYLYAGGDDNSLVWRLTRSGGALEQYIEVSPHHAFDVAVHVHDNLVMIDWDNSKVLYYNGALTIIGDGQTDFHDGTSGFYRPSSAAVCPWTGDIWVVDSGREAVRRFTWATQAWNTVGDVADEPFNFGGLGWITVDGKGGFLVADTENHQIRQWTPSFIGRNRTSVRNLRAGAGNLDTSSFFQQPEL